MATADLAGWLRVHAEGCVVHANADKLKAAADALEANERKIAEQAHEINTMKLVIRKMEKRRR